jgi:hypothetical protein
MMHNRPALLLVLLLAVAVLPSLGGEPPAEATHYWALAFENDTPQLLNLEDTAGKLNFYWYVVYRVKNPEGKPLPARVKLSLKLSLEKVEKTYPDLFDMGAEAHIEKKLLERPVCNWAEMALKPLQPGEKREGVAIFRVGNQAPDFDKMAVTVRGLAELRPLGREGNVRKFRERVLLLKYEQVASRWRTGKELKYIPEEWTLEDVQITDRGAAEAEESEKLSKQLEELKKKSEDLLKSKPPEPPPPPKEAPKSSTEPSKTPLAAEGPESGKPAPQLLNALRQRAAATPCVRAAFREIIGRAERRQEIAGSLTLGKDGKFAIERNLNIGTDRGLKECRVFDGQDLWVQTIAKGVGDTIRRWGVAATKKQWYTVDGRPEVDFATVANPARAWRLFGDELIYLGVEQMGAESAYVFEARPGDKFAPLLEGPLTGEAVGKASGRRIRFWLGAAFGFQLRLRVYDDQGEVIAALECSEVAPDAATDPRTFTFKPPAGVEVIDMNAAIAAADK